MRGRIEGIHGSWGSGLATVLIRDEDGRLETLYADNGPLVRALEAMFGEIIEPGHTVNVEAVIGREIEYGTDELGMLAWIGPPR